MAQYETPAAAIMFSNRNFINNEIQMKKMVSEPLGIKRGVLQITNRGKSFCHIRVKLFGCLADNPTYLSD